MLSSVEQDWVIGSSGAGDVRGFFERIGLPLPEREGTEAHVSCFARPSAHNRDDRTPSCSVNLRSGTWHCQGCGESGNAYRAAQLKGYEDKAAARLAKQYGLFLEIVKSEDRPVSVLPGERQLKAWRVRLRESPLILARLFELKGWSPWAVARLGLGWDGDRVTFAIRNAKLERAGVVRYLPGGDPKTLAVAGTRRDLFPAPESIRKHHPLFLVEGEGDAVAVWSLGLKAVAVPGAGSWRREWAARLYGRRVIVLPDCDAPGRQLAVRVAGDVPDAQVVDLEPSVADGSDIGEWVRSASREGGFGQMRRVLERLAG